METMNVDQWNAVIRHLKSLGTDRFGAHAWEIAEVLGCSAGQASRLLSRAVREGLVERRRIVQMTDIGRQGGIQYRLAQEEADA